MVTNETVTEETIRNELLEEARGQEEEEDEEGDNEEEPQLAKPVCSSADAKTYLEEIRRYFESRTATEDDDFSAISRLDNSLFKTVKLRQCSIDDFFPVV